jgi:enediyne biosynthesis protein E4
MSIFIRPALARLAIAFLSALLLYACDDAPKGAVDGGEDGSVDAELTLDQQLALLVAAHSLTGDPATPRGRVQIRPSEDPLVKLGQMLFFSQTLAGSFDASCGTCHLMDKGASDDISISVGVVPVDRNVVGVGRVVDVPRDKHSLADGGPNMHRNSITTFNVGLWERFLMFDGRIRVGGWQTEVVPSGEGQIIVTPESGPTGDRSGVNSLLEAVTKFPITNDVEMRGFLYATMSHPDAFRWHLMERLKGNVDQQWMREGASENWLALFRAGFGAPAGSADELITLLNMQRAIGRFLESQIFVDNAWREYLEGNQAAISDEAKEGAKLFLTSIEDGGLGCVSCHAGDRFSNEEFFNVGFPQIGRGFLRADGRDAGRWMVTRSVNDWFAHRVPMLLNVELTAPYGHAGTFESLEAVVRYHANPRAAVETFDFGLQQLPQYKDSGIEYPLAEERTREIIDHPTFTIAEAMLPQRSLTNEEVNAIVAFMRTLTDECAADVACISAWTPAKAEDPDGHMIGGDGGPAPAVADHPSSEPVNYPLSIDLEWPAVPARTTFADVQSCPNGMATAENTGALGFERKDAERGLIASHGFLPSTWLDDGFYNIEFSMIAGGLTATYLNDDCWPDVVFAGGDESGVVAYLNQGAQSGFVHDSSVLAGTGSPATYGRFSGVGVADLNGDYRRELVLGNVLQGDVVVMARDAGEVYGEAARLPMTRTTYGISFGDVDGDEYPEVYVAHWGYQGIEGTAPVLFRNLGGTGLAPNDWAAGTSSTFLNQDFNFTPKFLDARGVGILDIFVSSDFNTSAVLQNNGNGVFQVRTNRDVITDENGMGSALGDVDNDGDLDWFVTSVLDPNGEAEANWGVTGNRLYVNESTPTDIVLVDGTEAAGVRDGNWGWGTCMADFDHDGFLDIFHVNGFGFIPDLGDEALADVAEIYLFVAWEFIGTTPRLFLNDGDGTFTDVSSEWGLDFGSEGRGVICFDYDRDGDIDIGLVDNSTGVQFYENQIGHGLARRFLNLRLVGRAPNTDAIGAKVFVTADVGAHGVQRQMRVSEANSNFNSQNLPDLHFGLGDADVADVLRLEWPDGTGLICTGVPVNQFLVFDQRDTDWPKADLGAPDCAWHADIHAVP